MWEKIILAENSEFIIFAISSDFFLKKGMHGLDSGSKICVNEKLGRFKET